MRISKGVLESDAILLLTAVIWGFAFTAQRLGMEHIGPYAFNAVRFALGSLSLLPLLLARRGAAARFPAEGGPRPRRAGRAAIVGIVLFAGSSLQQAGLVTTTAGNAGFITCLYVVLVPLLGAFVGRKSGLRIWVGAIIALVGLYILSIGAGFVMAKGDLLELAGSFFWAIHILIVARFAAKMDAIELAIGQFAVCSALSLACALATEPTPFAGTLAAAVPILYGGIMSTGVAFTLQIVAQRKAHPAHASIILSMEALFAGVGGVILLGESLTIRLIAGGLLMLAGMIVSQLEPLHPEGARRNTEGGKGQQ
ncbi:MAG: DMT family transporter [Spirochaetaceae bacterium]|nr:DMT family transporter [Spirochaetaceae bacterium]